MPRLGRIAVLGAVHLDGKTPRVADEVEEIALKRGLTAEVKPFAAQATKGNPEPCLGRHQRTAQGARSGDRCIRFHRSPPGAPRHPPRKGEGKSSSCLGDLAAIRRFLLPPPCGEGGAKRRVGSVRGGGVVPAMTLRFARVGLIGARSVNAVAPLTGRGRRPPSDARHEPRYGMVCRSVEGSGCSDRSARCSICRGRCAG